MYAAATLIRLLCPLLDALLRLLPTTTLFLRGHPSHIAYVNKQLVNILCHCILTVVLFLIML